MRSFATLLTVGALMAHAVLGCCWHHGHAAAGVVEIVGSGCHGDHSHRHDLADERDQAHTNAGSCDASSSEHEEGCPPHSCGEEECVFAADCGRLLLMPPLTGVWLPASHLTTAAACSPTWGQGSLAISGKAPPDAAIYVLHQRLIV